MPYQHKDGLAIAQGQWDRLCRNLRDRSLNDHESGAFLLGSIAGAMRIVEDIVYYDELDPDACASGIVELDAAVFSKLWKICSERGLQVVADVHTHPHSARQSHIDQVNPMIATPGHVALILPCFARNRVRLWSVGVYEYRGDHRWQAHGGCRRRFLRLDESNG